MSGPRESRESDPPLPPMRGFLPALLWACYLGCSWTWVIGMLLPTMLVRDYGWPGYVVFAVPNVIGAGALGFVLSRPQASLQFVKRHAAACQWFTAVTIAFQVYVATWWLPSPLGLGALLVLLISLAAGITLGWRPGYVAMLGIAVGVAAVSIGCFSFGLRLPESFSGLNSTGRLGTLDLIAFLSACVMGFGLCPYLDLTFHRARQQTDRPTGKAAFAIGFGGVFATMILFTLAYAGLVGPTITDTSIAKDWPGVWLVLLSIHLPVQMAFTILVHLREGREAEGASHSRLVVMAIVAVVAGMVVRYAPADAGRWVADTFAAASTTVGGEAWAMSLGEVGYRLFITLYATVFPAYVLLVAIPWKRSADPDLAAASQNVDGQSASHKARVRVWIVVSVVMYPAAVATFVLARPEASAISAAAVLVGLAWVVLRRSPGR